MTNDLFAPGRFDQPQGVTHLLQMLREGDAPRRAAAAVSLGSMRGLEVQEALLLAASDPDADVRKAVERAWLQQLTEILGGPLPSLILDTKVRLAADRPGAVRAFVEFALNPQVVYWCLFAIVILNLFEYVSQSMAIWIGTVYLLLVGAGYFIPWCNRLLTQNVMSLSRSLGPVIRENLREQGTAAYERRDYSKALDAFRSMARSDPSDAQAWYLLGLAFDGLGDHEKELMCYNRTLALAPSHSGAWNNKGSIFHRRKSYAAAFNCFQAAAALGNKEADNNIRTMIEAGLHDSANSPVPVLGAGPETGSID